MVTSKSDAPKIAVPTYLSRLARPAPAAAPRLQPRRPIFPSEPAPLTDLDPTDDNLVPPAREPTAPTGTLDSIGAQRASIAAETPRPPSTDTVAASNPGPFTREHEHSPEVSFAEGSTRFIHPNPDVRAAPTPIADRTQEHATPSVPAALVSEPTSAVLLPPKQAGGPAEMNGSARHNPGPASAPHVSIGSIEVTVVPPTSSGAPAPQRSQNRPQGVGIPARPNADAARNAARGAARRWYGAGQS
jgi:hypothetical protein